MLALLQDYLWLASGLLWDVRGSFSDRFGPVFEDYRKFRNSKFYVLSVFKDHYRYYYYYGYCYYY